MRCVLTARFLAVVVVAVVGLCIWQADASAAPQDPNPTISTSNGTLYLTADKVVLQDPRNISSPIDFVGTINTLLSTVATLQQQV